MPEDSTHGRVMDDRELLKSAGLYDRDIATGKEEYNLAAILLLGKDNVIFNVDLPRTGRMRWYGRSMRIVTMTGRLSRSIWRKAMAD